MKFTTEQILEMAREAGFYTGFMAMQTGDGLIPFALPIGTRSCLAELERFATIAAQKPAQRKPLTDEEIAKEVEAELTHYWNGEYIDTTGARDQLTAFARTIESAIKDQS